MPKKDKPGVSSTPDHFSIPDTQSVDQEDESISSDTPGIIIQPGSSTLRLGLSTQLDPHSIPHLIAYRTTNTSHESNTSSLSVLKYSSEPTTSMIQERDDGLQSIIDSVTTARATNGIYDADSDVSQYGILNNESKVIPCSIDDEVTFQWSDLGTNPQFVIGNEVLLLHNSLPYVVYKPLRHGKLNTSSSVSRSAVLKQLEDLWCRAIEECLDIPRKEFKFYRVIICVSDMIDRVLCKDFMDILLSRLSFEAALIHQESVCATYGAGISTACVVDVGEERTHLCCVEDGMSNYNTRFTLKYGGNDITRFFYWLLKRGNFPYKKCSEDGILDGQLVAKLKEKYCHFDMTVWGVAEEEVIIPHIGEGGMKFSVHFADELVYAPMAMYYPQVLCLPSNDELMKGQTSQPPLLEDIFDETNWGSDQNTLLKGSGASSAAKNGGAEPQVSISEVTRRIQSMKSSKALPLDEAVHFCIDCSSSIEMKKKLYSSILLIGAGLGFNQAAHLLQTRLQDTLPLNLKGSDTVEVSSNPRDLSPANVSWRGGAVLGMLESCQELWIEKQEWEVFGVRLLRERSLFVW